MMIMAKKNRTALNISLKEITIKSICKTCNTEPLICKEWYEGHWGCVECGDPNNN